MIDLGQPVFNAESVTKTIKGDCPVSLRASTLAELNAVIRQNGVDFGGRGLGQIIERVFGDDRVARG